MSGTGAETTSVEIVQMVARKRWTASQKLRIIEATMQPGNSVSRVARQHGVSPAMVYKWRKLMLEGGAVAVEADEQVVRVSEVAGLKKRIAELERVLGKKTLEIEVLKAAVELGRKKKTDLARAIVRSGKFPVAVVARTLAVSRPNLYERPNDSPSKRGSYQKVNDAQLLHLIRAIVDARPTYGYRRVCVMLNRKLADLGLPAVNHKRVYRLMKSHNLLLTRFPMRNETRAHTGKVATDASDQRWCSDGFELKCANGEKVRVVFVLDCCDREVISFSAASHGYTAQMAQDALLQAVEKRFGGSQATHWIEWLTDNGSCFTARETREFARGLKIINCFTPVRSPESNGMAEALVKTIKRDYASCSPLRDANTVISLLHAWLEDYNEYAPHKGLKWLTPREFRRSRLPNGNFPGAACGSDAA